MEGLLSCRQMTGMRLMVDTLIAFALPSRCLLVDMQ